MKQQRDLVTKRAPVFQEELDRLRACLNDAEEEI